MASLFKPLLLSALVCAIGLAATARAQPPHLPELEALANYIGKWDMNMSVLSGADSTDTESREGSVSAEWILGRRFVQQTNTMDAADGKPEVSVTALMTYDPALKMYRGWWFASVGLTMECQGTWDEESKTMHWVSEPSPRGIVHRITAAFPVDGTEEWTFLIQDGSGDPSAKGSGTNTRRKKKK